MSLLKRAYPYTALARGQTMTEYALILGAIAVVMISLYDSAGVIVTELVSHVGPLL
jgi:Flp pilus assembly pilin Flp